MSEKPKKDRLGFLHTKKELEETQYWLENVKNGDVLYFDRYTKDSGSSFAEAVVNGKVWRPSRCKWFKPEEAKTLRQYVDEGYNLSFAGRYGDGKKHAWWNDCRELTMIDIFVLNGAASEFS